jgi:hypothetical protein
VTFVTASRPGHPILGDLPNLGSHAVADLDFFVFIYLFGLQVLRYGGARGRVALPYRTVPGTGKPGKDYEHVEGELIFDDQESEQIIRIPVIEEESYEKDALFFVEIMEPVPLWDEDDELKKVLEKPPDELTDRDRIAILGQKILPFLSVSFFAHFFPLTDPPSCFGSINFICD